MTARVGKGGIFMVEKGKINGQESNQIRTACLNFARDRFDLIR